MTEEMTHKERILAALTGGEVDRMPWCPFLAYWWENHTEEIAGRSMADFIRDQGGDPMLRGFSSCWKFTLRNVEISEEIQGNRKREIWRTPVGELVFGSQYSETGNTWFLNDHPVKEIEDLKILSWVYEHASLEYDPASETDYKNAGDDALFVPLVGTEMKTCFQSLVEKYVGTVNLAYFLADEPEAVEETLEVMRSVSDRTAEFCAQSPCEAFIFWEDSSTTNISPAMFEKYTMPEVTAWGNILHRNGKLLLHHACGHIKDLLPLMTGEPIDAVESISPPPTGNIDIADAFTLLPDPIALVGGIEPTFFENCSMDELDERVEYLLRVSAGKRYVLANSDSCPPGVAYEKFSRISRYLRDRKDI